MPRARAHIGGIRCVNGLAAHLAWGKVAPIGDIEDASKRQIMKTDPHSWAMFENLGICDLSLKFDETMGARWKPWAISLMALGHAQVCVELRTTKLKKGKMLFWQGLHGRAPARRGLRGSEANTSK